MTSYKEATRKAAKGLWNAFPVLIGVILLISLATTLISPTTYTKLFSGSYALDPLIGGAIGSVLAGNPVTSYVLGGELLAQGVSLVAVTAFLIAWVTVGIVQFPAEAYLLGKRFAITRNAAALASAVIAAIIITAGVSVL
ncbi:hypothetical protein GF367_03400 [Candidatus Woesearchaeota archaeon]|nr:hypothetical protein [Candidatus Woesearchaeota archaeon]